MDFRKIKRLHEEYNNELQRLSDALTQKYKRAIILSPTSDGLCIIFEDQDATGITLEEFELLSKEPGFDTWDIITVL